MASDNVIRVMLVDDHQVMRDLLRDGLEHTGLFLVVGEAGDGRDAVRVAMEVEPDVIVMDVIIPELDGIEACRQITAALPDTKVLMLTASNETDAIVRSIGAGATGYLQKYSGKDLLISTLQEVAVGEFRIPGTAARRLARAVRTPSRSESEAMVEQLTARELEIVSQFAAGLSYQEIGEDRNISALTVRNAVSSVQRKLELSTRQQLVVWAIRAGIVEEDQ